MDVKEIKEYLRVDYEEDDVLIETFISAAEEYLTNAGIKKNYDSKLYGLAIKLLVIHWYENRQTVVIGTTTKSLEYSLKTIMAQLRYSGDRNEVKQ